jgi:hypothetical protein
MVHASSVVIRITAWYGWLLVVLALMFGAYTCKWLDYCLSMGVQNALSIRAQEIGSMFAATGQIPDRHDSSDSGLSDSFVSLHQSGGSMPDLRGKTESHKVVPSDARRLPNSLAAPTSFGRQVAHDSRFLVATARTRLGNKEYTVEMGVPRRPIKTVFRENAITLVIGLIVALAFATWGSLFVVKRALVPVHKIALAVQAFPVVHPDENNKGDAVLEEIANLCVTVNEMVGQLEDSFQIGTGLAVEAFHAPTTKLATVREELASSFKNGHLSMAVSNAILCLLKESERLSDIARNRFPSNEDAKESRTERLRFYLCGLAARRTERLCALTNKLGADLASEAHTNEDYSVQW